MMLVVFHLVSKQVLDSHMLIWSLFSTFIVLVMLLLDIIMHYVMRSKVFISRLSIIMLLNVSSCCYSLFIV